MRREHTNHFCLIISETENLQTLVRDIFRRDKYLTIYARREYRDARCLVLHARHSLLSQDCKQTSNGSYILSTFSCTNFMKIRSAVPL